MICTVPLHVCAFYSLWLLWKLDHHTSFGAADKPRGIHWVWECIYSQHEAGTRQTGAVGLGEEQETVLYPTSKLTAGCVAFDP